MQSITLTDNSRRDSLHSERPRQWNVDVYFATDDRGESKPYFADSKLLDHLIAEQYYGQSAAHLKRWGQMPAPMRTNVVQAKGTLLPLVTIAPGMGVARANYAYLAAAFVRKGFVVAVIDLPYLGVQRMDDQRILEASDDKLAASENPGDYAPRLREFVADTVYSLDRLKEYVRFDPTRIVVTGHSSGGTVAVDVCRHDVRVSACVDFEGGIDGTEVETLGAIKPTLIAASRAKGRPEAPPSDHPDMLETMRHALGSSGNASSWIVKITGGSHMSYSDSPIVMPDTLSRFGGELLSPERSMELYTSIVISFAGNFFSGGGGNNAFERFLANQTEVTRSQSTAAKSR